MNAQNAHEYLPLVQALADGKIIQENYFEQWCDTRNPSFNMDVSFYRIKPEPRTFDVWINEKTKRVISVEDGDHNDNNLFSEWERITVQEVLK
jgi:hypothetical protein